MKLKIPTSVFLLSFVFIFTAFGAVSAAEKKPQDILAAKYPNEVVRVIKTEDINSDKKKETFIITESGNFFLINSKGILVLIDTGIGIYEGEELNLFTYSVTAKEKHVGITIDYLPSNTQLYVYRLQNGTLKKSLQLIGDYGVDIDKKGRVHQYWKDYKEEGGWDLAHGIFTWNTKTNKYKGTGDFVLE